MSLSVIYPPKGANVPVTIDIVAVHGLGGDATDSWTHPKSKAFWLKDFLPQQIPDARIMTFGYDASMAFGRSCAEIIDHAKSLLSSLVDKREESEESLRPLIFIAHSLGGIVVKQALLQSRLEPLYRPIKDATLGFIFLGTPHRGSDMATYGKVLASVANAVTHRPSARLLTALETNSDALLRLTTDFRFQLPDYKVYSFYEQQVMTGFSGLIVEKHSALLEVSHEEQVPVNADHRAMVKFENDDDPTFEKIQKRIRRMKNVMEHVPNEQLAQNNQYFEVPHLLSPAFTGRNEDLQRLTVSFPKDQLSHRQHQRRFVLFGLGGSGKTQLCLKYLHDQRNQYWGVFWVDASSPANIQQSFATIACVLEIDKKIDSVKRKLTNASQDWLLVFDNADDPQLNLSPYLPAGNRGDVIITSRNPHCSSYNTVGCQELGQLSPGDSLLLLQRTIYGTAVTSQHVYSDVDREIVKAVGYLALAIVQAGSYIREVNCSPSGYVEIYKRHKRRVLGYLSSHTGTDYRYSVYTTWQVSIEAIKSRQDASSHQALKLLDLLGFYHHDQIPIKMFYNIWNRPAPTQIPDYSPWNNETPDFLDYQQAVQTSTSLLASFSLITKNVDTLSLHPLVHTWCRDRMDDQGKRIAYQRALTLLTESVHWEYQSEDYTIRRSLVDHVFKLLEYRNQAGDLDKKMKILWWPKLAFILNGNGWSRDAVSLSEENLRLNKEIYGDSDPRVIASITRLAIHYQGAGEYRKCLQLLEASLPLQKEMLGEDHDYVLKSTGTLTCCYEEAGRLDEALRLQEKLVRFRRSKLGDDDPDTLTLTANLAALYSKVGRQDEALELQEKVTQLGRDELGKNHPDTLILIHNLALFYRNAGRLDEAIPLEEELVEARRRVLGDDHRHTLFSICQLARIYGKARRLDEAIPLAEEAVEASRRVHGDDHKDTKYAVKVLEWLSRKSAETSSTPVMTASTPAETPSTPADVSLTPADIPSALEPEPPRGSQPSRFRFRDLLRPKEKGKR